MATVLTLVPKYVFMSVAIANEYFEVLDIVLNNLLTTRQLAEYLKLKEATIRRKAKKGLIPSIRIGNRLRFDTQKINQWLLDRSTESK